jgi:hypothetical protein
MLTLLPTVAGGPLPQGGRHFGPLLCSLSGCAPPSSPTQHAAAYMLSMECPAAADHVLSPTCHCKPGVLCLLMTGYRRVVALALGPRHPVAQIVSTLAQRNQSVATRLKLEARKQQVGRGGMLNSGQPWGEGKRCAQCASRDTSGPSLPAESGCHKHTTSFRAAYSIVSHACLRSGSLPWQVPHMCLSACITPNQLFCID